MKKSDLLVKFKHHLTLKNFSESTIRAYQNGLHIFLNYIHKNNLDNITPSILESFFFYCKKEAGYSYSMMKQLLASVRFLYVEVLKESIDFDFNIPLRRPSKLPVVLSVEEVERLLNSFSNIKHKVPSRI